MNIFVSKVFGYVLAVMHVLTILVLLAVVSAFATGQSSAAILGALGGAIAYVVLVGIASTLIAIRERIEQLIEIKKAGE
jgi:hypothetical protein